MNLSPFKVLLTISLCLCLKVVFAMPVGFNQAWFNNHYGSQYLDGTYDPEEVERIFKLAADAGSRNVRLWFFESAHFPMLIWQNGQLVGAKPDFIKNVLTTLKLAQKNNIQIYMTIFDGQAYKPSSLDKNTLKKMKVIYSEAGSTDFLNKVISPLLKTIAENNLSSVISRIDLSNEMDAVIKRGGFDHDWKGAKRMLCQWREEIKKRDEFKNTPVTFSIRLHPIIILPLNILEDDGPMKCADYLDFHSYHDQGKIYRCNHLKKYSEEKKKDLILGEFGQAYLSKEYDDKLQARSTTNYINNAESCGFKEALAWRLSDIRPGENKEARYSFEAFGQMRPAYWLIQKFNLDQN